MLRDPRTLSVVIPAYNERPTLLDVVRNVVASEALSLVSRLQVVIVDDCSTDGTEAIVAGLATDWRALVPVDDATAARVEIVAVRHARNQGKGAGLRTAFAQATGDFVLVQDADLEYDPRDYPKLLRPLLEDRADVVYGSRFLPSERRVLFFWHSVGNNLITLAVNAATDLNLSDAETGYKAFRTSVLRRLDIESERFGVEIELTAKLARAGCRFYEVPISYHGRGYDEGKKITWKDGVDAMVCIARFGLARNLRARAGRLDAGA
jgi:glycosyltransferase involved in cell wall biosynthesis